MAKTTNLAGILLASQDSELGVGKIVSDLRRIKSRRGHTDLPETNADGNLAYGRKVHGSYKIISIDTIEFDSFTGLGTEPKNAKFNTRHKANFVLPDRLDNDPVAHVRIVDPQNCVTCKIKEPYFNHLNTEYYVDFTATATVYLAKKC